MFPLKDTHQPKIITAFILTVITLTEGDSFMQINDFKTRFVLWVYIRTFEIKTEYLVPIW